MRLDVPIANRRSPGRRRPARMSLTKVNTDGGASAQVRVSTKCPSGGGQGVLHPAGNAGPGAALSRIIRTPDNGLAASRGGSGRRHENRCKSLSSLKNQRFLCISRIVPAGRRRGAQGPSPLGSRRCLYRHEQRDLAAWETPLLHARLPGADMPIAFDVASFGGNITIAHAAILRAAASAVCARTGSHRDAIELVGKRPRLTYPPTLNKQL